VHRKDKTGRSKGRNNEEKKKWICAENVDENKREDANANAMETLPSKTIIF